MLEKSAAGPPAVVCVASRGENGLAIVRALGRAGVVVHVFGYEGVQNLASESKYCQRTIRVRRGDSAALLAQLREFSALEKNRPVLFFDNDEMMAMLSNAASELATLYSLTVPLQRVAGWLGKERQRELAVASGLRVPQSWCPSTWDDLENIERVTPGKLLAKPIEVDIAHSKPFKIIVAEEGRSLSQALRGKGLISPMGLIVQEYIEGATENLFVSLAYLGSHGQPPCIATGVKIRQSRPEGGVMAVGQVQDVPVVREMTLAFAKHLDYQGILGIEFKRATNRNEFFFIEASFRTELFHSMGWRCGVNLPLLAYRDLIGCEDRPVICDSTASHYWINFRTDLNGLVSSRPRPGVAAFLMPYLSPKAWAVFACDDLRPWARSVASMMQEFGSRLRTRVKGLWRSATTAQAS